MDDRLLGLVIAGGVVGILLGDGIGLQQIPVAVCGDPRQVQVGFRGGQVGSQLPQGLIDFGGVDLRQQLAGFHAGADIHIPFLQVTVGAGVDGSVDERLHVGGEHDLRRGRSARGMDDGHAGDRHLPGFPMQTGARLDARQDSSDDQSDYGQHGDDGDPIVMRRAARHLAVFRFCTHREASALAGRARRPCSKLKNAGTKNRVATVAKTRPPMTARPSGAFCSPPSPMPSAIGTMPMIMASAVISTGRKRVKPACSAAVMESLPSTICSLAKLTTRMLLAVATPMHMIAPVKAGTLTVVRVMNRIHTIPASAAGSAEMMMKGSSQDWKFTTIRR